MNTLRARRFKTLINSSLIALVLAVGLTVTFVDAQRTITGPTRPQTGSGNTGGTSSGGAASEEPGSGTSTGSGGSSGTGSSGTSTGTTTIPENLLSGYAWSTNVGWIRMSNCSSPSNCDGQNYGVSVATSGTTRAMTGYGWSPYIGWVSFNGGATAGCPSGSCQASVDWTTGKISGWARACSVLANSDCSASGGMVSDAQRGGWDGFIALRNPGSGAEFGVKLDTTTNNFAGQAWGSDVVGWVDFSGVKLINPECQVGDDCYCPTHPGDTVNCVNECKPNDTACCTANPTAIGCTNNCAPGTPCYCNDPAHPEHAQQSICNSCGIGTDCWCHLEENMGKPECSTDINICSNIQGERGIPSGAHVTNGRCVCNYSGTVLKKDPATGVYACVDLHYNEVKR